MSHTIDEDNMPPDDPCDDISDNICEWITSHQKEN